MEAERYLREWVAPRAAQLDRDPQALKEALDGLGARGLLALRRPAEFGGPDLDPASYRAFQESVARASGALAFLQTQHQSAVAMVARSSNAELKARVLPGAASGESSMGIAFGHLRRPGPPPVRARPIDGDYLVEGTAPWVTGFGFYPEFLLGAQLPDGSVLFALVPFAETESERGRLRVSEPMPLLAMSAALTVEVTLEPWWACAEDVVAVHPPGWIRTNDLLNVAVQGHFAIGCARAGLDVAGRELDRRGTDRARAALARLEAEWEACRSALAAASGAEEEATEQKLRLRAWAIDLAVRCAHAAVVAAGGRANLDDHPAQRVYREALVFSVVAQTSAILEATIERLAARGGYDPSGPTGPESPKGPPENRIL